MFLKEGFNTYISLVLNQATWNLSSLGTPGTIVFLKEGFNTYISLVLNQATWNLSSLGTPGTRGF